MAGSIFAQMNQQTRTSMRQTGPYGQGGIQASIDQDTNDRSANDVVGQIERIGDQPERSQISRRFREKRCRQSACSCSRQRQ